MSTRLSTLYPVLEQTFERSFAAERNERNEDDLPVSLLIRPDEVEIIPNLSIFV